MVFGPVQWALSMTCLLAVIASSIIAFSFVDMGIAELNTTTTRSTSTTITTSTSPTTRPVLNTTRPRRTRTTTATTPILGRAAKQSPIPSPPSILTNTSANVIPRSGEMSLIPANTSLPAMQPDIISNARPATEPCAILMTTTASTTAASALTSTTGAASKAGTGIITAAAAKSVSIGNPSYSMSLVSLSILNISQTSI